ncbi:MAG: DNA recombination protein RmuC [Candidatus Cloacimonetes bacterium HGW-Cloacimonetes-2]|nr:MAG: DNA recombination protein RmuC [Candidatus Cloacimonetes bacterium HGW-Cloacimonetes-2]
MQRLLIQQENSDKALRDEFHKLRTELMAMTAGNREEIRLTLESLSESLSRRMNDLNSGMQDQMQRIRDNNEKKLEEMRHTVDEKLQQTLESRLGESFRQVSERLEQVHKGLGEMKVLATDVGDLKKVLSNVSTRGAMGELQLEKIISQLLSPEQYEKLYKPRPRSPEVVEFAIKLPGKDEGEGTVYLPIDSKFPLEDYHNLVQAYESGNPAAIEQYRKALIIRIKSSARDIRDKYINPPATTDFALLFLPIEGLFAEALRDPAVFETIQREMHVILTGPTTLAAILNSLQLGFRSLAIEKRSSEVWRILGAVKTEFSKFGGYLDKTKKKLEEAHKSLDDASDRTRHIERKLKNVQEISYTESVDELGFVSLDSIDDEPEES